MADSRFDSDHPGPNTFSPAPLFGYEAPSVFSRYKWLAIAFLVLVVAGSIWLYRAPHKPMDIKPSHAAPSAEPVYVEPLKPASG
jgi:hypothetical protein